MPKPSRRATAFVALLAVGLLAACGGQTTPSSAPPASSRAPSAVADPSAAPSAAPSLDAAGLAYSRAMCPIFTSIIDLDDDLAALRALGASGDDADVSEAAAELESSSDALLDALTALEAVPSWDPGAELRFRLISALHAIRTQLIAVIDDPEAATAAGLLAELPFVASAGMDRSMQGAIDAGMTCDPGA